MANSVTIDALRQEVWRKELWKDVEDKLFFAQNGMMTTKGSKDEKEGGIVAYMDDLKKSAGDTITLGLTAKLGNNTGVTGDNELEGNESQITPYSEQIAIDQWRDAVRLTGRLDEQKSAYDMRTDAKEKLSIRIREMIERQVFLKLAGVQNSSLVDVNGVAYTSTFTDGTAVATWSNTADYIPDADEAAGAGARYICANSDGTDALASTDLITPQLLLKAKIKAELASPRIEPVEYKGKKYYCVFVHPWQYYDLIDNATMAQALREAWWRGEDNPLFSGADLVWNGIIIFQHEYVPFLDVSQAGNSFRGSATGTDCAVDAFRALLVGKKAIAVAKCEDGPRWKEKSFDYDNKWAISCGFMGGVQKVMFNSKEYGVIAVDTAATPL